MKRYAARTFAIAVIPLGLAAALFGPMAGAAQALPKNNCATVQEQVYNDWAEADFAESNAEAAAQRLDEASWAYYSSLAQSYNNEGDSLYNQYSGSCF